MDTGEEYPMKGPASVKALRLKSQCEQEEIQVER